jgi:type III secretion protein T
VNATPFEVVVMLAILGARLGVALAMFPMFSEGGLPISVRGAIVAALSLCLVPVVGLPALKVMVHLDAGQLMLLLLKEVALGLLLGLVGSSAFWAVHAAGAVIENQAGLSMATTVDPLAGQEDSLLGGFLVQVLAVIFLAAGGLLSLLGVLYESFRVWPISAMSPDFQPGLWLRGAEAVMRTVMELALRVAAPFVILLLMVEVCLGLLSRYAPQFDVVFLAIPLKAALTLVLLLLFSVVLSSSSLLPDVAGSIRRLLLGGTGG